MSPDKPTHGGKRAGAGRPKLEAAKVRSREVRAAFTPGEYAQIAAAAELAGKPVARWLAERGVAAARRAVGKAKP